MVTHAELAQLAREATAALAGEVVVGLSPGVLHSLILHLRRPGETSGPARKLWIVLERALARVVETRLPGHLLSFTTPDSFTRHAAERLVGATLHAITIDATDRGGSAGEQDPGVGDIEGWIAGRSVRPVDDHRTVRRHHHVQRVQVAVHDPIAGQRRDPDARRSKDAVEPLVELRQEMTRPSKRERRFAHRVQHRWTFESVHDEIAITSVVLVVF